MKPKLLLHQKKCVPKLIKGIILHSLNKKLNRVISAHVHTNTYAHSIVCVGDVTCRGTFLGGGWCNKQGWPLGWSPPWIDKLISCLGSKLFKCMDRCIDACCTCSTVPAHACVTVTVGARGSVWGHHGSKCCALINNIGAVLLINI